MVLEYFVEEELDYDEAVTRQEIVLDLIKMGRIEEAYAASEALLAVEDKYGPQTSRLEMYANHTRLLARLGKPVDAIRFAEDRLQSLARDERDPFGQIELMSALRDGFASLGEIDEAIATAEDMFALIEDRCGVARRTITTPIT